MHYVSREGLKHEYNDNKIKIIGCNKTSEEERIIFFDSIESFDKPFTNEYIGISDQIPAKIGNISDALEKLKNKIINELKGNDDLVEISRIIYETVHSYFGGIKKVRSRLNYYEEPAWDEGTEWGFKESKNEIAKLKGTGEAECVEWAALSHNLLHSLGIKSVYKSTRIILNGEEDIHAYNLIEFKGKYYIFDTTVPSMIKGQANPLIAEISKEEFDIMCIPHHADVTISINTVHKSPFNGKDEEITYNTGNGREIKTVPSFGNQNRAR